MFGRGRAGRSTAAGAERCQGCPRTLCGCDHRLPDRNR